MEILWKHNVQISKITLIMKKKLLSNKSNQLFCNYYYAFAESIFILA